VVVDTLRDERVLAVTAVDGVNVVSGETAAYDQTGYVFGGGQQYAINGWRKSNQEIAAGLTMSEGTVKFHINHLLQKLGATDRTQAVLTALKRGFAYLD